MINTHSNKLFSKKNWLNAIQCGIIKILLGLVLLTTQAAVFAQNNENNFEKVFIEIDGEEVFDVWNITQDHLGYIWLDTNLGLVRYNGLEGKKYAHRSDASSESYVYIQCLFVDYAGDLWIGSSTGLSKYSSDCDCLFEYPSKIENYDLNEVRSITEDKNNTLWIGTGMVVYFDMKEKATALPKLDFSSIQFKGF